MEIYAFPVRINDLGLWICLIVHVHVLLCWFVLAYCWWNLWIMMDYGGWQKFCTSWYFVYPTKFVGCQLSKVMPDFHQPPSSYGLIISCPKKFHGCCRTPSPSCDDTLTLPSMQSSTGLGKLGGPWGCREMVLSWKIPLNWMIWGYSPLSDTSKCKNLGALKHF